MSGGCGKIGYASQNSARRALVVIRKRRIGSNGSKTRRTEAHVYACPECGTWHLASRRNA